MRLVLASASPRRAELLRAAGFVFETLRVDLDERGLAGEPPEEHVRRLAADKSGRAMERLTGSPAARPGHDEDKEGPAEAGHYGEEGRPAEAGHYDVLSHVVSGFSRTSDGRLAVLGADTVVVVDGVVLGKPGNDDEAEAMLRRLSGRTHEVLTGVSLRLADWHGSRVESTTVELSRLTEAEIRWYRESGEGRDKAGAYAIQGLASRFIPRIAGSYSNVVGLPIAVVYELLGEIASRRW